MQQANFLRGDRDQNSHDATHGTVRRARVPVLEDGEGGGACAAEPAPRRARLVHGRGSPAASPEPVPAPAPPARLRLKANESAAAGCAATPFPVFFLNSSGGGAQRVSIAQLSGNAPPHAPRGPRGPGPPSIPLLQRDSELSSPSSHPAPRPCPPPRRGSPPRSPAPLALKRSRTGAGASERGCGAAAGLREGDGGKPGVERPPPARRPGSRGPRGSGGTGRARARPRTCPAGTLSAPRVRCASRSGAPIAKA